MKKCAEHTWKFQGIVSADYRLGMTHRMCSVCQAELYEWATKAELRKHDPEGTIMAEMKRRGYKEAKAIGGRRITRKEALKGLGDPKTWEKDKKALMKEFRKKPAKTCPCHPPEGVARTCSLHVYLCADESCDCNCDVVERAK